MPDESSYSVLAILSLVFAFAFPIAGIVLGAIAFYQLKKRPQKGKGFAIAGIIIGSFLTILLPMLIIMGDVTYFSVLSPAALKIPDQCRIDSGMVCDGMTFQGDSTIIITLSNVAGKPIEDVVVSLESECSPADAIMQFPATMEFTCQVSPTGEGEQYRSELRVSYTDSKTGFGHQIFGKAYLTNSKY